MRIALIGGGPSALYLYQRLVQAGLPDLTVTIYEKGPRLGPGMPYSPAGANPEHSTNVSSVEVPALPQTLQEWAPQPLDDLEVVPRLLFGDYLAAQFQLLLQESTEVHLNTELQDLPEGFDYTIICTGHRFPHDDGPPRCYRSPYPPSKLPDDCNHPVALRGSSLTAVDAVLTLALRNAQHPDFKMVMHARGGLLPSVRWFLDGAPDLQLPSQEAIERIKSENGGYFPLDLLYRDYFVKNSGVPIGNLTLEEFVEAALHPREHRDPFVYLAAELAEAEASIKAEQPIDWKDALALFNYAANYPAKHFSAEDLERLTKTLRPLVAVIIAHLPRANARLLLKLHREGRLDLVEVGEDSEVEELSEGGIIYRFQGREVRYQTYVDCIGQQAIPLEEFPFPALRPRQAYVDGQEVPGAAVDDDFQVRPGVFLMAVPYMTGHNPDYSGLDFCAEAARRIVSRIASCSQAGPHNEEPARLR